MKRVLLYVMLLLIAACDQPVIEVAFPAGHRKMVNDTADTTTIQPVLLSHLE